MKFKLLSPNDIVNGKKHFSKENGEYVPYVGMTQFRYKDYNKSIKIYKKIIPDKAVKL
jgi:hypothetical protein